MEEGITGHSVRAGVMAILYIIRIKGVKTNLRILPGNPVQISTDHNHRNRYRNVLNIEPDGDKNERNRKKHLKYEKQQVICDLPFKLNKWSVIDPDEQVLYW